MPSSYKTPGVYIEEISKFPPSIAVNAIPDTSDWDIFPRSQYVSQGDWLPHQVLFCTYPIERVNAGGRFRFTLIDRLPMNKKPLPLR
ncbi:hypothetical protein [Mastigocoleus sp. MO_188.B34]|uniref:hypothetical protein n=1 Tax=Mastigocoleus sp. MO_188.B34 TaxID=3036635 RepID=UPI002619D24C|nr:hypothetical protein [Mastigocoleus sp. MO_188.B34]